MCERWTCWAITLEPCCTVAMGIGASIEARFPFLDEKFIETASNLPYRHKKPFAPTVWEKITPSYETNEYYLVWATGIYPKVLSHREKLGFEVSAFERMHINKNFFKYAFVTDFFKLRQKNSDFLFETAE